MAQKTKKTIDLKNLKLELESDATKASIKSFLWHLAGALVVVILAIRVAPDSVSEALEYIVMKAREVRENHERKLGKFARRFLDFVIDWAEYITVSGLRILRRTLIASGLVLLLLCGSLTLKAPELTGILTFALGIIVMVAIGALRVIPKSLFGGEVAKEKFIESVKLGGLWPIAIALALIMLPHSPIGGTFVLCLLLLAAFFIIYGPLNWAKRLATWLVYSSLLFQVVSGGASLAHKGTFGGRAKDLFTSAKQDDIYHQKKGEAQDKENKLYEEHTYGVITQTSPIALIEAQVGRKDTLLVLNARVDTIAQGEEVEIFSPEQIRSLGVEIDDKLLQQIADTTWHYPTKAKVAFGHTEDVTLVAFKNQSKRQSFSDRHRIFVFYVPSIMLREDPTITPFVSGTRTESAQHVLGATYPMHALYKVDPNSSEQKRATKDLPVSELQLAEVEPGVWHLTLDPRVPVGRVKLPIPPGTPCEVSYFSGTVYTNMVSGEPVKAYCPYCGAMPNCWGFDNDDRIDGWMNGQGTGKDYSELKIRALITAPFLAPLWASGTNEELQPLFFKGTCKTQFTMPKPNDGYLYFKFNDLWVKVIKSGNKQIFDDRSQHNSGSMVVEIRVTDPTKLASLKNGGQ